jgi:hypothetical protein
MQLPLATITAKGQRLPRLTRAGPDVLPFRIEERDLLAWRWIFDTRFLRTDYLRLLLPGSAQQITRRAQRWFHGGYVDRIRTGYADWILAIGNKGADEVCMRFNRERGRIDWDKKNQELKYPFLRPHTLSIARFRVSLELALRAKSYPEAAEHIRQWPADRQQAAMEEALTWVVRRHHLASVDPSPSQRKAEHIILAHLVPGMVPEVRLKSLRDIPSFEPKVRLCDHGPTLPLYYRDDAGIERRIEPDWSLTLIDGSAVFDCHVEADRSTIPLESETGKRDMYLKLRAYLWYWQQTGHPFRMLMTCLSPERLEHMRALAREVVGTQAGSGLFWFALEREIDPFRPETFWSPIWRTPKIDQPRTLLRSNMHAAT